MRLYHYVGPADILASAAGHPAGVQVASPADLAVWVAAAHQYVDTTGPLVATFVISAEGVLLLADRSSEHVQCAGGQPVRSAGEMVFDCTDNIWRAVGVSNQSTGYCPEAESWPQVAAALDAIPLAHPGQFTAPYIFRRCPVCGQINLVKDGDFVCAVCGANLPPQWNLDAAQ